MPALSTTRPLSLVCLLTNELLNNYLVLLNPSGAGINILRAEDLEAGLDHVRIDPIVLCKTRCTEDSSSPLSQYAFIFNLSACCERIRFRAESWKVSRRRLTARLTSWLALGTRLEREVEHRGEFGVMEANLHKSNWSCSKPRGNHEKNLKGSFNCDCNH